MLKNFYALAWFLLIGSVVVSALTGSINEIGMVAFGLIGLVLIYALALWSVISNDGAVHQG